MFAQAATTLPFPSGRVAKVLAAPSHPWSVTVEEDGRSHLAKVGVTIGRLPVYKRVRLQVGASTATLRSDAVMLPVSWIAIGGPPIFPKMEGTLHVESQGNRVAKLTLNARYDPPLGELGELVDRALLHRVADATMRDFLERLTRALAAELGDESDILAP